MSFAPELRQRVTLAVLAYTLIVTVVVIVHGYIVNEKAERLVWESLLESELTHFTQRRATDPDYRWTDTENLRLYGRHIDRPIPPQFEQLAPGIHDEVLGGERQYIALVSDVAGQRTVLALDISDLEHSERSLALFLAAWTAPVVVVLAALAYLAAGWLVRPLSAMARTIASWTPDRPGQRIAIGRGAPREAAVIAQALDEYEERLDRFLERERAFINMASHELRTPIAVMSGAIDVVLDGDGHADSKPYLEQVRRTAQDMNRLISLLLALAKDPSRLRDANEPVDLAVALPLIARDHAYLAELKDLTLDLDASEAPVIAAPLQIVQAAVGNLLRNAIENSDRGTIAIAAGKPGWVQVSDPGHGMSEREMSRVYTRIARSGPIGQTTGGIGIELVTRLCEHLGWRLAFESRAGGGTLASLDFLPESE